KSFEGSAALAKRRASPEGRLTTLVAGAPICEGDEVRLDGERAGQVCVARQLSGRTDWAAWALLDVRCAAAGIDFEVRGVSARSVSPPLLENLSLKVDVNRHSFRHGRLP